VMAIASVGSSLVPDAVRIVAGMPRTAEELQRILAAPSLVLSMAAFSDPAAPQTVDIPQGGYPREMLEALGKQGIGVREIPAQRVMEIKGTSAVALLGGASGVIESAERPGVVVFADGEP
jgi:hypothetical protein